MNEQGSQHLFCEDDLLPIRTLADLAFCERRAALHHIEGIWQDNIFTAEGTILHERTHDLGTEVRSGVRIARGLRLRSLSLGLSGVADVVEFHCVTGDEGVAGVPVDDVQGLWRPVPVEYKRGRLRREEGYEIQLCAQALCLEEMLGTTIARGGIYYGKTRRRLDIEFDAKLRNHTEGAAARLHELIDSRITPTAAHKPKCESCLLAEACLPTVLSKRKSARRYLAKAVSEAEEIDETLT